MARWSAEYNIPWRQGFPENYPFKVTTLKVRKKPAISSSTAVADIGPGVGHSLRRPRTSQVQRILTASSLESDSRHADLVTALYHAFWVEKKGVQHPEVHNPVVINVLGQDVGTRVIERVCTFQNHPVA